MKKRYSIYAWGGDLSEIVTEEKNGEYASYLAALRAAAKELRNLEREALQESYEFDAGAIEIEDAIENELEEIKFNRKEYAKKKSKKISKKN